MADHATEMAQLRRQLAEARLAAETAETQRRELQATVDALPKTALQYMHPELSTPTSPQKASCQIGAVAGDPEPAIVLPPITNVKFELRTNFITLVQANQFHGESERECPKIGRAHV